MIALLSLSFVSPLLVVGCDSNSEKTTTHSRNPITGTEKTTTESQSHAHANDNNP
ncbi:MAG TPA: hypothetical protein VLI90_12770 [Tepidisphaeraceae bacterium]|nr:hypothetical protein [Tepidisphaeraceae bacterium]